MADPATEQELNKLFAPPPSSALSTEVLSELLSILRIQALTPQELLFKWESYMMKMGLSAADLNLENAIALKKDLQERLERDTRAKAAGMKSVERKGHGTPRSVGGDDMFGIIDGVDPGTPLQSRSTRMHGSSAKRKPYGATPPVPKFGSNGAGVESSPAVGSASAAFSERQNAGQTIETLNDHLPPFEPPIAPGAESRIKVTANTDLKKFYYKPLAMHLSEASEVLDDRIDEFQSLVADHHNLDDSAFGSAASQSTNEIIAVGRVVCDTPEGKLNAASLMLETSRKTGAGLRVPLKVDSISYEFFPGQIVAVKGINASGAYFSASEVMPLPMPPPAVSSLPALEAVNERLAGDAEMDHSNPTSALNVMISSGPFTADDNMAFEPLNVLCEKAAETCADALILIGPMLDIEHPLLASGDFDLPDDPTLEPDKATLNDVFRALIGQPLRQLAQQVPNITIILVPSTRDAVVKHVSWPQEPFDKKVLGLPKQARMVTNPVTISLNEILVGISASDILYDLRREEVMVGRAKESNLLARLARNMIDQRHFYPIFPPGDRTARPKPGIEDGIATGTPLDISYLKLGEWLNVRPDILITPSSLAPFAKVVESVVIANPGSLSKRKGPGTYAQFAVYPRQISDEERQSGQQLLGHHLFDRTRVDIVRI